MVRTEGIPGVVPDTKEFAIYWQISWADRRDSDNHGLAQEPNLVKELTKDGSTGFYRTVGCDKISAE